MTSLVLLTVTSDSAGSTLLVCRRLEDGRLADGQKWLLVCPRRDPSSAKPSPHFSKTEKLLFFSCFCFSPTMTSSTSALRNLGSSGSLRLALFMFSPNICHWLISVQRFHFLFFLSPLRPTWFAASFPLVLVTEFKRKFDTWKIVHWNHYSSHQSKHSQSWHALEVVAHNTNG